MNLRRLPASLLLTGLIVSSGLVAHAQNEGPATRVKTLPTEAADQPSALTVGFAEARRTDRDVLVVLNISDWGGWCARLREDILQNPTFVTGAAKDFVSVRLDFPKDHTEQSEDERRANTAFARKYHVTGFPVVLLLDKNGRAYARTGYMSADAAAYLKHLTGLKQVRIKRDALIAKARRDKGQIRADGLAQALRTVDGSLAGEYAREFEELRALDPQDRYGVLLDYDINLLFDRAADTARREHSRAAALGEYDAFLYSHAAMPPEKRQRVLHKRFALLGADTLKDLTHEGRTELRLDELKSMLALAPSSPLAPEIRRLLETEEAALKAARGDDTDAPGKIGR